MPLAVESLTPNSSDAQIQKAISSSIQTCMQEGGREQKQCQAIAYSIARKKTHHSLGRRSTRQIRGGLEER